MAIVGSAHAKPDDARQKESCFEVSDAPLEPAGLLQGRGASIVEPPADQDQQAHGSHQDEIVPSETRRGEPTPQRPRRQDNEPRCGMQSPCTTCPRPMMRLASSRGARRASNGQGKLKRLVLDLAHPDLEKAEHRRPPAAANSVPAIANSDAARDKQIPTQRRAAKTQNDGDDSRGRNERCAPRCHPGQ